MQDFLCQERGQYPFNPHGSPQVPTYELIRLTNFMIFPANLHTNGSNCGLPHNCGYRDLIFLKYFRDFCYIYQVRVRMLSRKKFIFKKISLRASKDYVLFSIKFLSNILKVQSYQSILHLDGPKYYAKTRIYTQLTCLPNP